VTIVLTGLLMIVRPYGIDLTRLPRALPLWKSKVSNSERGFGAYQGAPHLGD